MGNNATVTSKVQPTTIKSCRKLVSAYIKQIEDNEYIIPPLIINICLTYYHPTMIMIWLSHIPDYNPNSSDPRQSSNPLYITDINNPNKYWQCSIHEFKGKDKENPNSNLSWNMYCNSVTFAKNATHCLPNNVTNSILKYYQTNDNHISIKKSVEANPYHIIFKSGGLINNQQASDHCNAIIFNGIEFQKSSNES